MIDLLKKQNLAQGLTILGIALIKLMFVYNAEIVALNYPHDDFWYVRTAFNSVWGGEYTHMAFIHLPIYSMYLKFLSLFGMPVFWASEILWLLGCGLLSFAIRRLGVSSWLAIVLFLFLAFHPYTGFFQRTLAETFLAITTVYILASGILIWSERDQKAGAYWWFAVIVYVGLFSIAYCTRKEGVVLLVPVLILLFFSFSHRDKWWQGHCRKKLLVPLVLAPIFGSVVVGTILSAANYYKWGVWARYELSAPGYVKLISALNSIDAGATPRYVTVTNKMLDLAYKESATFSELQPFMQGYPGKMWFNISHQESAITEGIGNGWFYWALRDVAAAAGWHRNAKTAEDKYLRAAEELGRAFESGRLQKRALLVSSFMDPDYAKWVPALPASVLNMMKLMVLPVPGYLYLPNENALPIQLKEYIAIADNNKKAYGADDVAGLFGWIKLPEGSRVGVGVPGKTFASIELSNPPRSDIAGAYPFYIHYNGKASPSELHVTSVAGENGFISPEDLRVGAVSTTTGNIQVPVGVENLLYSRQAKTDHWAGYIFGIYEYLGYLILLSSIIATLVVVYKRESSTISALFIMLLAMVVARVGVFAIIDASSWNAMQARYMLPAVPVLAVLAILGMVIIKHEFRGKWNCK